MCHRCVTDVSPIQFMVRKLLKRKFKILSTKKLKTWSHRKSSLSHWAVKQLLKRQVNTFHIRYPSKGVGKGPISLYPSNLLHKQFLSKLVSGPAFLHSLSQEWNAGAQPFITKPLINHNPMDTGSAHNMHTNIIECHRKKTGTRGILSHSLPTGPENSAIFPLVEPWVTYKCNPKSLWHPQEGPVGRGEKNPTLVRGHWKNIYSLDQLMCHQYDSQFRRKHSPYKAKLTEIRKCSALYGKLAKKQRLQLVKVAKKSNGASNWDNIPLYMESRLDMAVKQCFVFETLMSAHHWISQGKIMVNNRVIKSPSHLLIPGDCVAISNSNQVEYRQRMRALFHAHPLERKYVQSGNLLSRWNRWAILFNNLRTKTHQPWSFFENKMHNLRKGLSAWKGERGQQNAKYKLSQGRIGAPHPWPDKGIQCFWYGTGRFNIKSSQGITLWAKNGFHMAKGQRVHRWLAHRWLAQRRWRSTGRRIFNWKFIYRRRIFVFSQWLLRQNSLINDGLYYCRWKKAFIRKKSGWIKEKHALLSLQKPLHFEVSFKKLCALFLYPPQKLLLPTAIDFRKLQ